MKKGDRVRLLVASMKAGAGEEGTVQTPGEGDWDGYPMIRWDSGDTERVLELQLTLLKEDLTTLVGVLEAIQREINRHNERMALLSQALHEVPQT